MSDKRSSLTYFGKIVQIRLAEKNMTQRELAEKLGVTETYIHLILYGYRKGGKKTIEAIQDILDININQSSAMYKTMAKIFQYGATHIIKTYSIEDKYVIIKAERDDGSIRYYPIIKNELVGKKEGISTFEEAIICAIANYSNSVKFIDSALVLLKVNKNCFD